MDPTYLIASFFLIFGMLIGSFLNVVIYRVPRNESIIYPSSHCPDCGRSIRAFENIPVLSYLFLRGRCAGCAKPISIQYPLIEFLTGSLFLAVFLRYGLSTKTAVFIPFTAVLIALSAIDYHTKLLPDVITLPSAILASILSLATLIPEFRLFWDITPVKATLGILLGAGPLAAIAWLYFLFTRREGLGIGDIKLMIVVGALLGPSAAFLTIFIGAVSGTLFSLPMLLLRSGNRYQQIPFGPFLSLGAWVSMMWAEPLIRGYLQLSGLE